MDNVLAVPKQFPTAKEMTAWALAYFRELPSGALATYAELAAICEQDPRSRPTRAAILRAGRLLLKEHSKLLVNVRDVGYQIAKPGEHASESQRVQRGASRRLRRGLAMVVHVALDAMTDEERAKTLIEQVRLAMKLSADRALTRRKDLPARPLLALPSAAKLIELYTRRKKDSA